MSLIMAFAIKNMIPEFLIDGISQEAARMVEVMHYGLFPAILIIGLTCLLCRHESIDTAKKIMLAYIIGTSILMFVFFKIFSNEALMNFDVKMAIPDIAVYLITIIGYIKAK